MRYQRIPGLRLAPVLVALASLYAEEDDLEDLKLSFWEKSVNLRGALGYKDNVLLSNLNREGSGFWLSGLDFSLLRASLDGGPQVTVFASGEDRRYFSSEEIRKEQLVLSQAKVTQEFAENWAVGGIAQYLYADQVFDASATEELFETLPVKSHNMQVAPIVTRELPWNSELELRLNGERQFFNEPLDDYWEIGTELTYTKKYGNRSTISFSYTYDHRLYDTRNALDLDREPIENIPLRFDQHELELTLNHSWDKERHWRSRFRVLFEINQDNGPGFYDYYRYRVMKRFGYWGKDWQATIEGKVLHYDYQEQPVPGSAEVREIWEYVLALHGEKTIWKKLKVFADNEFEVVNSNYGVEEYTVNTVMVGVDWEF
jgi:hypothetical protein